MDYQNIFERATCNDLVYLDPPYQGTGMNGGFNYAGNITFDEFVISLYELNNKSIPFILSFDDEPGIKLMGIHCLIVWR